MFKILNLTFTDIKNILNNIGILKLLCSIISQNTKLIYDHDVLNRDAMCLHTCSKGCDRFSMLFLVGDKHLLSLLCYYLNSNMSVEISDHIYVLFHPYKPALGLVICFVGHIIITIIFMFISLNVGVLFEVVQVIFGIISLCF